MARMSIDDMLARDTRVDRLARLCGWSRRETRACLEDVWALCYDRVVPYLPVEDIEVTAARDAISPPPTSGFTAALRLVGLARDAAAGDRHFVRKDGTRVPWPDQNWRERVYLAGAAERVGYLLTKRSAGSEGGVKSGQSRRSKTKQSFNSAPSESQARGNPPDPVPDSAPDPVPEDQNSPSARTIPGDGGQPGSGQPGPRATQQEAATPGQGATAQGAVPAAGDVAEPQFDPTGYRVERPPSPGPFVPAIAGPYNPDDPRAIGRLAESTWRRISDAAIALAAELKLPEPFPFPVITPSTHRAGFVELKSRIREEGELAPTVCDRVVENLVKQARSKRSVDWLAEKVFGDKAWVNARNGIDPSARPPVPRRGDPLPPAPPPPRPAPPPPDPVLSAEDRAEILALAARVGVNPDAVAAAELASGRVPAHVPTAELVKRFGDGQRAPPDDPITEEPRKPPARRKATT